MKFNKTLNVEIDLPVDRCLDALEEGIGKYFYRGKNNSFFIGDPFMFKGIPLRLRGVCTYNSETGKTNVKIRMAPPIWCIVLVIWASALLFVHEISVVFIWLFFGNIYMFVTIKSGLNRD